MGGWADRIGAVRWVLRRFWYRICPPVTISDPAVGVSLYRDVEVRARDGVILRVNVYRPEVEGGYPVLMSAQPYSKDVLPIRRRRGGYRSPRQYRLMPQSVPFAHLNRHGFRAALMRAASAV
jgi:predicted acyl esterase